HASIFLLTLLFLLYYSLPHFRLPPLNRCSATSALASLVVSAVPHPGDSGCISSHPEQLRRGTSALKAIRFHRSTLHDWAQLHALFVCLKPSTENLQPSYFANLTQSSAWRNPRRYFVGRRS